MDYAETIKDWHLCEIPTSHSLDRRVLVEEVVNWLDDNIEGMYAWDIRNEFNDIIDDQNRTNDLGVSSRLGSKIDRSVCRKIFFENYDDLVYFKMTWCLN